MKARPLSPATQVRYENARRAFLKILNSPCDEEGRIVVAPEDEPARRLFVAALRQVGRKKIRMRMP